MFGRNIFLLIVLVGSQMLHSGKPTDNNSQPKLKREKAFRVSSQFNSMSPDVSRPSVVSSSNEDLTFLLGRLASRLIARDNSSNVGKNVYQVEKAEK